MAISTVTYSSGRNESAHDLLGGCLTYNKLTGRNQRSAARPYGKFGELGGRQPIDTSWQNLLDAVLKGCVLVNKHVG